jgi:hypothetical protein
MRTRGRILEKEPITSNITLEHNAFEFFEFFGNLNERLEHDPAGQNDFEDPTGGDGLVDLLSAFRIPVRELRSFKDILRPSQRNCDIIAIAASKSGAPMPSRPCAVTK